ncbi:MAG TPA: alpha/beta hydrolase-fold protein, partial [Pedobacter sp.]
NFVHFASAQGKPDSIFSKILNEKRQLKILLPPDYKPGSNEKYDVVYILDGENNLEFFSQIQHFVKANGYIPDLILVAVINTNRNHDFTPTELKHIPTSGGADNFISFFKQELIPYINKTYPVTGQNILYGHSFGGLFAVYAMLSQPDVFSSYISADPSLWYDKNLVNKMAKKKLPSFSKSEQTLYISGRGDGMDDMGISMMDSILKVKAPKNLTYKVVAHENETHGSVQFKTVYDGLKLVYDGYQTASKPIEFHPMNGIVLKDKPFTIFSVSNLSELRYTTDGTKPTPASPKIEKVSSFSGPMKLTIKSFSQKGRLERIATGNFVLEEPPAPVDLPKNFKSGGLSYSYYEGEWDNLPDFNTLKHIKTGIADKEFNFTKLPSKNNFGLLLKGMLEIKEEGYYLLGVASDDGAKLYLKDKLIINHDGLHGSESPHSFLVPLKKGFYPVRLEYFQKAGGADLQFKYIVPGKNEPIDIPSDRLYNALQ